MREWALAAQPARAAGDPGKGTLLQVIDQAGQKLRYTAKQRRRESGSAKRAALNRRLKRKTFADLNVPEAATCGALLAPLDLVNSTPAQLEKQVLRGTCSKSCQPDLYAEYVAVRCKTEAVLEAFYRRPRFRAQRFTAFLRSKVSLKTFAEVYKAKYGPGTLLMVGDWSANTNVQLKNQAPTMGVGLLRGLAAEGIRTALTCEAYTSSICPECTGRTEASGGRHHLLRCPHCPFKWWNRDILGARNILKRGAHLLQHGVEDPLFVAA